MHCFWYQKGLNKIQRGLSAFMSMGTTILVAKSAFLLNLMTLHQLVPHSNVQVAKKSTALFLVPIRTKTVTKLFFSPSKSMKTTKSVDFHGGQKFQCSHVQIAKKVQSTVFGTKMLQIYCSCKEACM